MMHQTIDTVELTRGGGGLTLPPLPDELRRWRQDGGRRTSTTVYLLMAASLAELAVWRQADTVEANHDRARRPVRVHALKERQATVHGGARMASLHRSASGWLADSFTVVCHVIQARAWGVRVFSPPPSS
jgi:hypothetical protein